MRNFSVTFPIFITIFCFTISLGITTAARVVHEKVLNISQCMEFTEPQVCYHCDSSEDSHCGNPFQYSHYYNSKNVYLTECEGCCIKVVHPPTLDGTRRILRSCTDLLPEVNFPLDENCDASGSERQICFCKHGLCNGVNSMGIVNWAAILSLLVLLNILPCWNWY